MTFLAHFSLFSCWCFNNIGNYYIFINFGLNFFLRIFQIVMWRSSSVLKTGRREVLGSIPGRTCRPSRSEFFVVFSETPVNTSWDSLERSHGGHFSTGPSPTRRELALNLQFNSTLNYYVWSSFDETFLNFSRWRTFFSQ